MLWRYIVKCESEIFEELAANEENQALTGFYSATPLVHS